MDIYLCHQLYPASDITDVYVITTYKFKYFYEKHVYLYEL